MRSIHFHTSRLKRIYSLNDENKAAGASYDLSSVGIDNEKKTMV